MDFSLSQTHLVSINYKEVTDNTGFSTQKSFKWLHRSISLPLFNISNGPSVCIGITLLINIAANIYRFVCIALWCFFLVDGWNSFQKIASCVGPATMLISRFFSIHYFWKYYDFTIMNDTKLNNATFNQIRIQKRLQKNVQIIKVVFIITTILYIISHFVVYAYIDYSNKWYMMFVDDFTVVIFVFIPTVNAFCISSALFIKHYHLLLCLTDDVERKKHNKNYDYLELLEKYKRLLQIFESDYNSSLKYSVYLWLLFMVMQFWTTLDDLITSTQMLRHVADAMYSSANCGIIFLFFYTSSALTETFKKFERMLYRISFSNDETGYWKYQHLLLFMSKYRLTVTCGRFEMTVKNATIMISTLVMTKVIAWLVYGLFL